MMVSLSINLDWRLESLDIHNYRQRRPTTLSLVFHCDVCVVQCLVSIVPPQPPCLQSRLWCDNVILQGGEGGEGGEGGPPWHWTHHNTVSSELVTPTHHHHHHHHRHHHHNNNTTREKKHIILTVHCTVQSPELHILISSSLEIQLQPYLDTTEKADCFYYCLSLHISLLSNQSTKAEFHPSIDIFHPWLLSRALIETYVRDWRLSRGIMDNC